MGKIIRDTGSEIISPIHTTGAVTLNSITRNIDDKVLTFGPASILYNLDKTSGTRLVSEDGTKTIATQGVLIENFSYGSDPIRTDIYGMTYVLLRFSRNTGAGNFGGAFQVSRNIPFIGAKKMVVTLATSTYNTSTHAYPFSESTMTITRSTTGGSVTVDTPTSNNQNVAVGAHKMVYQYNAVGGGGWMQVWVQCDASTISIAIGGGTGRPGMAMFIKSIEIFN